MQNPNIPDIEIHSSDITNIRITPNAVWIQTRDGREACEYFANYPTLCNATAEQLQNYTIEHFGIYWPDIDEGLGFAGFFHK